MLKKAFTAAVLTIVSASLFAGKTVVEKFEKAAVRQKDGSYCIKSGKHAFSTEIIPVNDLTKETIVTMDLKAPADGAKGLLYYVGIVNFDKKGRRIEISYVNPVKDSDTVLAAPCKKTDTVLKVKDASKFKVNTCIAYNTKKDLSDLPNFTASERSKIKSIVKKGDIWEVTLTKPCNMEYPANTPVRTHFGGWYQYIICGHAPSADWKPYTIKIAGTQVGNPGTKWTVGTAGIKFIIFNNGKNNGKEGMFFRNLTITTPDK